MIQTLSLRIHVSVARFMIDSGWDEGDPNHPRERQRERQTERERETSRQRATER